MNGSQHAVGNDVVDLGDPVIAEHHRRDRFVSRVCTLEERKRIASSIDLWTLFASKEAAYKALVNLGYSPGFAHRQIVVSSDLRTVRWRAQPLALQVHSEGRYVHAVAWSPASERPRARVACTQAPESQAARALLSELVADVTGCEAAALQVVRDPLQGGWDGFGPPRVEHRGTPLDASVSLSHDGGFVAAALLV